jgi:hypothetical protein
VVEQILNWSTVVLIGVTAHGSYITAVPAERRKEHAKFVRSLPITVYVLVCHHGRWILWQVTTFLPRKRG